MSPDVELSSLLTTMRRSIAADNSARLERALGTVAGLSLSDRQARLVRWLAGWDGETVNTLSQIIEEAYSAGFCDGLGLTACKHYGHFTANGLRYHHVLAEHARVERCSDPE